MASVGEVMYTPPNPLTDISAAETEKILCVLDAVDSSANENIRRLKGKNANQFAIDAILKDADQVKDAVRNSLISYNEAPPTTVLEVRRPELRNKVVKLTGLVGSMSTPAVVERRNANGEDDTDLVAMAGRKPDEQGSGKTLTLTSTVVITDENGNEVPCYPTYDRRLVERLQGLSSRNARWEFIVLVTVVPSCRAPAATGEPEGQSLEILEFAFFLVDCRPVQRAIQLVSPRPGEIQEAMTRYGALGRPLEELGALVMRCLEIQGAADMVIIPEAIRVQILAAASEGRRIHAFLLGPPAVGKSLVHKAAKALQPTTQWALACKMSEAGLIGIASTFRKHRRPGLVPLAHLGGFGLEDANQLSRSDNRLLCGIITHVMEAGEVSDATAAQVTYLAQVSITIDANRKTQVRMRNTKSQGLARLVEDTGIPVNILSRFHYLAEIPRDIYRQIKVAEAIGLTKGYLQEERQVEEQEALRLLKVYLAVVRDRHPEVHIPSDVREAATNAFLETMNVPAFMLEKHDEINDFMTRHMEIGKDYLKAHARLCNRSIATIEDLHAVLPLMWRRTDFIKTIITGGQADAKTVKANARMRQMLIGIYLVDNGLQPNPDLAERIRRSLGMESASLATIEDDLRALAADWAARTKGAA